MLPLCVVRTPFKLLQYADPVLDLLDKDRVVRWRLFREACVNHKGNYVKVSDRCCCFCQCQCFVCPSFESAPCGELFICMYFYCFGFSLWAFVNRDKVSM